jgi:hypothetical protein
MVEFPIVQSQPVVQLANNWFAMDNSCKKMNRSQKKLILHCSIREKTMRKKLRKVQISIVLVPQAKKTNSLYILTKYVHTQLQIT